MNNEATNVDVLCVGHASYDLVFSVAKHPGSDEKVFADALISCGGGPAANAAIAVSKLGLKSAFAGYLGNDLYGDQHNQEFEQHSVNTDCLIQGKNPTPLSTIIVKPDGKRALINYKGSTTALSSNTIDFSRLKPKVILFDGHEPHISLALINSNHFHDIPTVLDAGSLHEGSEKLANKVDYLVASEKFACQYAGDVKTALKQLAKIAPSVVITLGDKGLIWQRGIETGQLKAFPTKAIDTTGAGDAFHGAFATAVALDLDWPEVLRYAGAAGTLCCNKMGARIGLPSKKEHNALYSSQIEL
mgnify:CR=1 FL=1